MGTRGTATRPSTSNGGHQPRSAVPEIGVTVEGRWFGKVVMVLVVVAGLAIAGFAVGRGVARLTADGKGDGGLPVAEPADPAASASADPVESGTASGPLDPATGQSVDPDNSHGEDQNTAGAEIDAEEQDEAESVITPAALPVNTYRFAAFDDPTTLIDGETNTEANNSIGVDMTGLGFPDTGAVVADLVVRGRPSVIVSVHPGDRPSDALRFTIPSSGRLLVPHLVASTDDEGRIVVSADEQVAVEMTGIGTYVLADRATAGRFVPTGSVRIGSLVTATDGRRLQIDLADVLGDQADHVGRAVVRVNANVSPDGGSVAIGSDPPIPWPAPAAQDFGMAGTELLTVTPDENAELVMDYAGGSVLTVDLVGYYTNDNAPESADGLFILAPRPELRTVDVGQVDVTIQNDWAPPFDGEGTVPAASRLLITVEAVNGAVGGSVAVWPNGESVPTSPAFALAPNQGRSSSEWFNPTAGQATIVRAPDGAVLNMWIVGAFT